MNCCIKRMNIVKIICMQVYSSFQTLSVLSPDKFHFKLFPTLIKQYIRKNRQLLKRISLFPVTDLNTFYY